MLRFLPLQAYTNPHSKYIIIIDEINRGNLAKIFGELVYSLEYRGKVGHEGQEVILPYSNDKFIVPENIWIIATMNSADRSIALVDYAIRRRFFFIDFVANDRILEAYLSTTKSKIERNLVIGFFNEINHSILNDEKLGKHYQLGHSYFMKPGLDEKMLRRIWKYSIKPILEEYYFEDYAQLEKFENSLKVIIPDRNSMSS